MDLPTEGVRDGAGDTMADGAADGVLRLNGEKIRTREGVEGAGERAPCAEFPLAAGAKEMVGVDKPSEVGELAIALGG